MPELKEKLNTGLQEARILVLIAQVLLAFQLRSMFEARFESLPATAQDTKLVSLLLMLAAAALLMSPTAFHRISDMGEDTPRFQAYMNVVIGLALLPFSLSLSIDGAVVLVAVGFARYAGVAAAVAFATMLLFWFGLGWLHRKKHMDDQHASSATSDGAEQETDTVGRTPQPVSMEDKVEHILTETLVVLPGMQALLAFQFSVVLTEGFGHIARELQIVHLVAIAVMALSTILLMTPSAYHRIAERGQATEHFHQFASRLLLAAMAVFPIGMAADMYVVSRKVLGSPALALATALLALSFFYGLWFGYTSYVRHRHGPMPLAA